MEKYFFIKPEDTLFFRDGRPFERGVESFARSIFPPLPSVFYGALRTACILESTSIWEYYKNCSNKIDSSDEKMSLLMETVGFKDKLGTMEMVGPFVRDDYGRILIQMPYDILRDENKVFFNLVPTKTDFYSNLPVNLDLALSGNRQEGEYDGFFINLEDLINYYLVSFDSEQLNRTHTTSKEDIVKNEYKVGIKIDKKIRATRQGYLYSAEHVRLMDNYGFLIKVNNYNDILPDKGYIRLGGDTRVAYFEKIDHTPFERLNNIIEKKVDTMKYLKFILLTPAIFDNGWYPDFLRRNETGDLYGAFDGLELRLISAVLGKPVYIGGFDIVKKHPKETKKAVPAGSVFFFEVTNSKPEDLKILLSENNFKSIESNEYYKKQGFGITLIGGG